MKTLQVIIGEEREWLVEAIAHQLSCFQPGGCGSVGPAAVASQTGRLVTALQEAVAQRRTAPFAAAVRSVAAEGPERERLSVSELYLMLELLEALLLQRLEERGERRRRDEDRGVVESVLTAGRAELPRDSRYEPEGE